MPSRSALRQAFKARLLRRLGSWGACLTVDDVDRIFLWISKFLPNADVRNQAGRLHRALHSGDAGGELVKSIFSTPQTQRRRIMENLIVNWGILGGARRYEVLEKEGWLPPSFAVISPTMRCNLRCEGCYAFEYTCDDELTTDEFDGVIRQCKDLGMYFITISGGEPFTRGDLLEMLDEHDDCFFQIYTNGTLIDEKVADRLLESGNAMPAISVEGYRDETDARRGPGTYDAILEAMKRLQERGLFFGISVTATRHNSDLIVSDAFYDHYRGLGVDFAWLFQYIPIGREPNVDLMSTPEQRTALRHWLHERRPNRPVFIGDFWNDGAYVGGCMAGGRLYFHVTSNGNVEPCVFCHFTVGNVREKALKEILSCDFFRSIRYEQPYSKDKNLYTPCMIIDNPKFLRRLVDEHDVRPSHDGADTIIRDPEIVAHLDRYSERLRELTEPEWHRDHYDNPGSEWFRLGERALRQWAVERPHLEKWHEEYLHAHPHADSGDRAVGEETLART